MSWFSLNKTMGSNYTVDPGDIVNTKTALNQLGYYDVPPHRGIDDWTDDSMFNGIKAFQKDNILKVDGLMRPGGPTEAAINLQLADTQKQENGTKPPLRPGQMSRPHDACTQCPTPEGGTRDHDNPWLGTKPNGTEIRCVNRPLRRMRMGDPTPQPAVDT